MKSCENCAYYDMGRDEQPCFGCVEGINYEEKETEGISNFEKIKSMSIDDLAKWLDENGQFDTAPWMTWWNDNYCEKCEPITVKITEEEKLKNRISCLRDEFECAYCEINNNKCKFFPEMEDMLNNVDIIKLWLESEVE